MKQYAKNMSLQYPCIVIAYDGRNERIKEASSILRQEAQLRVYLFDWYSSKQGYKKLLKNPGKESEIAKILYQCEDWDQSLNPMATGDFEQTEQLAQIVVCDTIGKCRLLTYLPNTGSSEIGVTTKLDNDQKVSRLLHEFLSKLS